MILAIFRLSLVLSAFLSPRTNLHHSHLPTGRIHLPLHPNPSLLLLLLQKHPKLERAQLRILSMFCLLALLALPAASHRPLHHRIVLAVVLDQIVRSSTLLRRPLALHQAKRVLSLLSKFCKNVFFTLLALT